jgi:hypothetical protein
VALFHKFVDLLQNGMFSFQNVASKLRIGVRIGAGAIFSDSFLGRHEGKVR